MDRILYKLGVSLALGLIVGLQRERTDAGLAGFRTFPLVTVFGTLCATLSLPDRKDLTHWPEAEPRTWISLMTDRTPTTALAASSARCLRSAVFTWPRKRTVPL